MSRKCQHKLVINLTGHPVCKYYAFVMGGTSRSRSVMRSVISRLPTNLERTSAMYDHRKRTVRRTLNNKQCLRLTQHKEQVRAFIATVIMENLKGNQEASGSETVEPQRFQNQVRTFNKRQSLDCAITYPGTQLSWGRVHST